MNRTIEEPTTKLAKIKPPTRVIKRITFEQAEALAAEKGVKLTHVSEVAKFYTGGGRRRRTNVITNSWYKLSSVPDKKFALLIDVRDFLMDERRGPA
jgi:hypothetical protein